MSSSDGPLGPGLRRCAEDENSRRYFRSTRGLVEPEKRGRLEDRGDLGDADEQRCQPEYDAIERSQIRGALPGAVADLQLMFQQHRFRRDSTDPAGAEELYGGDQKVNREDEQIAHGVSAITPGILRKTARNTCRALRFANSHPTGSTPCSFRSSRSIPFLSATRAASTACSRRSPRTLRAQCFSNDSARGQRVSASYCHRRIHTRRRECE